MLEELAQRAAHNMSGDTRDRQVALDPVTIALLLKLVTVIIKCIRETYDIPPEEVSSEAQTVALNITGRKRRLLKRAIRRQVGWWTFWRKRDQLMQSVLKTGAEATVEEMTMDYNELK